jgi:hypothetical protein
MYVYTSNIYYVHNILHIYTRVYAYTTHIYYIVHICSTYYKYILHNILYIYRSNYCNIPLMMSKLPIPCLIITNNNPD